MLIFIAMYVNDNITNLKAFPIPAYFQGLFAKILKTTKVTYTYELKY